MKPHVTIRGKILYTSRKPGREGAERGRENFMMTVHRDGRRTLEARCEIDDPPNVLRSVVLTLRPDWFPTDGFVRVSVGDELVGSSWYCMFDDHAECEGLLADAGRISERADYSRPPTMFVTHPIQADAWNLPRVDFSRGPSVVTLEDRVLMTSLDHRGATGPSLVWHDPGLMVEFIGEERVTVAAGSFDALHFCFGDRHSTKLGSNTPGEHPPYEMWTTADGDYIMLKATVTGYMMTHYELTELERFPARP